MSLCSLLIMCLRDTLYFNFQSAMKSIERKRCVILSLKTLAANASKMLRRKRTEPVAKEGGFIHS